MKFTYGQQPQPEVRYRYLMAWAAHASSLVITASEHGQNGRGITWRQGDGCNVLSCPFSGPWRWQQWDQALHSTALAPLTVGHTDSGPQGCGCYCLCKQEPPHDSCWLHLRPLWRRNSSSGCCLKTSTATFQKTQPALASSLAEEHGWKCRGHSAAVTHTALLLAAQTKCAENLTPCLTLPKVTRRKSRTQMWKRYGNP